MGPGYCLDRWIWEWPRSRAFQSPCKMEWLGSPVPLLMMVWREARICGLECWHGLGAGAAYRSEDVYGYVHMRCHVNRNSVRGV